MRISNYKCMLVVLLIFFSRNIFAELDTTFGTSGIVTTSIGSDDFISSITLQPSDTHIVAVGSSLMMSRQHIVAARYTPSGALDSSFDSDGIQTLLIGTRSEGNSVVLQSDEKIVIGGFAFEDRTNFALVRYNTDGSLDSSFNGSGIVTTELGTGALINAIKILSDGDILAGGTTVIGSPQFTLARYTSGGPLDTSFGIGGIVHTQIGFNAVSNDLAIQEDGKIIAVGYAHPGDTNQFALVRYNTDGSLDDTFGVDGIVVTPLAGDEYINSVILQPDGNIVVAGTMIRANIPKFIVARYNTAGNLDTTFNGTGIVITEVQNGARANAVALQSDGKIVVGGTSGGGNNINGNPSYQFTLVRYTTSGVLDTTFGTGGIEITSIGNVAVINSLAIQPDDKIVAAGSSDGNFALARYLAQ